MKVYITKYCLTQGIFEREAELRDDNMILVKDGVYSSYYHKPEWHDNLADASKQAESMRLKEIEALKRKMAKLEKLKFN